MPLDWSPDGRELLISDPRAETFWIYSAEARTYTHVDDGIDARYFPDGRRVILQRDGAVLIRDLERKSSREILRIPGERLRWPQFARDNSILFFTRMGSDGDIWLVRFGEK